MNQVFINFLADHLTDAIRFAARVHGAQTFATDTPAEHLPYLAHLMAVFSEVSIAASVEPTENDHLMLFCAILHDTIEDSKLPDVDIYAVISKTFGSAYADGVLALSKNPSIATKRAQLQDSLERILLQPKAIWKVKLADRIVNLQPPPHTWSVKKIQAYADEAQLILEALGDASPYLRERLREKILEYRQKYLETPLPADTTKLCQSRRIEKNSPTLS